MKWSQVSNNYPSDDQQSYPTDDQQSYPTDDQQGNPIDDNYVPDGWSIQTSVDSDNTVTCVECLQKECGSLFKWVFENKEALPFPCYYEDIQRCWNRVVKPHSIRLDRFYFIILSYYCVILVIYKPRVASRKTRRLSKYILREIIVSCIL